MEVNMEQLRNGIISNPEKSKIIIKDEVHMHEIFAEESFSSNPPYKNYILWPDNKKDIETVHLILMGETGKGKTTTINGILNCLMCVNCWHHYRMVVPTHSEITNKNDTASQTEQITVYTIPYVNGMPYISNFKLIDTPGMLDTRGNEIHRKNIHTIKKFLENYIYKGTLFIGIVTEASLIHSTETKNVIEELQIIVDEQSNVNVISIATHADPFVPACYSVLEKLNLKLDKKIKINNGILYSSPLSHNDHLEDKWEQWETQIRRLLDYITQQSHREGDLEAFEDDNYNPELPEDINDGASSIFSNNTPSSYKSAKGSLSTESHLSNFKHTKRVKYEVIKDSVQIAIKLALDVYTVEVEIKSMQGNSLENHLKVKTKTVKKFKSYTSYILKDITEDFAKDLDQKMESLFEESHSKNGVSNINIKENQLNGDTPTIKGDVKSAASTTSNTSDEIEYDCPKLISATTSSSIDSISKLLKYGACASSTDNNGAQAIHWASYSGRLDVMQLLVDHKADIRMPDNYSRTPLHWAALVNQKKACEWLINRGAEPDLSLKDVFHHTPADKAEKVGHIQLSQWFRKIQMSQKLLSALLNKNKTEMSTALEAGADPNVTDQFGYPALVLAAMHSLVLAKLLLDAGTNVSSTTKDGAQAVHWASYSGRLDVLKLLVEYKADIRVQDDYARTPLHWAASVNQKQICEWLLKNGAEPDTLLKDKFNLIPADRAYYEPWGQTKLYIKLKKIVWNHWSEKLLSALDGNDDAQLSAALDAGADPNVKNKDRCPALIIAVMHSSALAKRLLDAGADVDATTKDGDQAIHKSSSNGDLEVLKLLICRGADIQALDEQNRTPYQLAVTKGHGEVCSLLRSNDGDLINKNMNSCLPVDVARNVNNDLELFLNQSVEIYLKSQKSIDNTPALYDSSTIQLIKSEEASSSFLECGPVTKVMQDTPSSEMPSQINLSAITSSTIGSQTFQNAQNICTTTEPLQPKVTEPQPNSMSISQYSVNTIKSTLLDSSLVNFPGYIEMESENDQRPVIPTTPVPKSRIKSNIMSILDYKFIPTELKHGGPLYSSPAETSTPAYDASNQEHEQDLESLAHTVNDNQLDDVSLEGASIIGQAESNLADQGSFVRSLEKQGDFVPPKNLTMVIGSPSASKGVYSAVSYMSNRPNFTGYQRSQPLIKTRSSFSPLDSKHNSSTQDSITRDTHQRTTSLAEQESRSSNLSTTPSKNKLEAFTTDTAVCNHLPGLNVSTENKYREDSLKKDASTAENSNCMPYKNKELKTEVMTLSAREQVSKKVSAIKSKLKGIGLKRSKTTADLTKNTESSFVLYDQDGDAEVNEFQSRSPSCGRTKENQRHYMSLRNLPYPANPQPSRSNSLIDCDAEVNKFQSRSRSCGRTNENQRHYMSLRNLSYPANQQPSRSNSLIDCEAGVNELNLRSQSSGRTNENQRQYVSLRNLSDPSNQQPLPSNPLIGSLRRVKNPYIQDSSKEDGRDMSSYITMPQISGSNSDVGATGTQQESFLKQNSKKDIESAQTFDTKNNQVKDKKENRLFSYLKKKTGL